MKNRRTGRRLISGPELDLCYPTLLQPVEPGHADKGCAKKGQGGCEASYAFAQSVNKELTIVRQSLTVREEWNSDDRYRVSR